MLEFIKTPIIKACQKVTWIGRSTGTRSHYQHIEHDAHYTRCFWFIGENAIQGDLYEFGVAAGATLALMDKIASDLLIKRQGMEYRIFGFDSFEGMPEASGKDRYAHIGNDNAGLKFNKGEFRTELEIVKQNLRKRGANLDRIHLIKGWYDKTLTEGTREEHKMNKAAFINIDCDFYESAKLALDWCEPLIQQGTILNFDDFYCYKGSPEHGEMLAFSEFLEKNPHLSATPYSAYSWHGQAFIMNRSA